MINEESIRAREAMITGRPPRIPPLRSEEAVNRVREYAARAGAAATGGSVPLDHSMEIPEMLLSVMCHPELYERLSETSIQMMAHGTLTHRDRELVVLRVAWLCQAPYEWGEHVWLAKRAGISSEEIERVTEGSSAPGWTDHERALLAAAEELRADAMITDETWSVLAATLEPKQLFELTVLVGQRTLVAYFQNALRLPLSDSNPGLTAR